MPFDPLLLKNEEGVCVLFFPTSTTTAEFALWLSAHLQRMREKCGRDYPWKKSDTEIALYRYLVSLTRSNGYKRHDDLIGLRDDNTGLPLVISHRYHPLGTSLAAHDRHGEPYSLVGIKNVTTEPFVTNRFRKSSRPAALYAVVLDMLPILQVQYDRLVALKLAPAGRLTLDPAKTWARRVWTENALHPIEMALSDSTPASRLRDDLDRFQHAS